MVPPPLPPPVPLIAIGQFGVVSGDPGFVLTFAYGIGIENQRIMPDLEAQM